MSSSDILGAVWGTWRRMMTALRSLTSSGRMQWVTLLAEKPYMLRADPRLTATWARGGLTRMGLKLNCSK